MDYLTDDIRAKLKGILRTAVADARVQGGKGYVELEKELIDYCEKELAMRPKTFRDRLDYWVKGFLSGVIIYSFHYFGIAFVLWLTLKLWFPMPYLMVFGIFATLRVLYVNVTKMSRKKNSRLLKKWRSNK